METINGRIRAHTVTTTAGTGAPPERILTTRGVRIAYDHPTPRVPAGEWNCAGQDPEIFFPENEETYDEARRICADCGMRAQCLALGVARDETGVWGGVLLEMGKVLDHPRKLGRPRKVAA